MAQTISCRECGETWRVWTDAPVASRLCPNCAARSRRMERPRPGWGALIWYCLLCLAVAAVAFVLWGRP